MLTRTAGYAINAVLTVAEQGADGRPARANDLAASLDIPANYLSKILQTLARSGVLVADRGPNGGYRLALPAAEIRLLDVVGPFDDLGRERQCLLGRGTCGEVQGCPAHREWREASTPAFEFFKNHTLASLLPGR